MKIADQYSEKLSSFKTLQHGWDSYGALAPDADTLVGVGVFLAAILNGDLQIVPTRRGGVQIEVHQEGWDVEVEFDPEADDGENGGLVNYVRSL